MFPAAAVTSGTWQISEMCVGNRECVCMAHPSMFSLCPDRGNIIQLWKNQDTPKTTWLLVCSSFPVCCWWESALPGMLPSVLGLGSCWDWVGGITITVGWCGHPITSTCSLCTPGARAAAPLSLTNINVFLTLQTCQAGLGLFRSISSLKCQKGH